VNALLLPPRLLLRALDDLHTIAVAAARIESVERRLDERLGAVAELGDRIEERLDEALEVAQEVRDAAVKLDEVVATGDRVVGVAADASARIDEVLATGERVADVGARVEGRMDGREVADAGRQIAEALPALQRAIHMAEPLEGAVERLGRIVDRLPGGRLRPGGSTGSAGAAGA
jgi:ABC-type transporter Mla subunit MlaD